MYLSRHVFSYKHISDSVHVFLLLQMNKLPGIGHYLQSQASLHNLIVVEQFPTCEALEYAAKHSVKILVNGGVRITHFLCLVQQSLAQKVFLVFGHDLSRPFFITVAISVTVFLSHPLWHK